MNKVRMTLAVARPVIPELDAEIEAVAAGPGLRYT